MRTALCCCGVHIQQGEAVLQVLRMTGSAMQLLDLSDHLPGLPRLKGLKKWYARDKIQYYSNWEEASQVSICSLAIHRLNFLILHSATCYRSHVTFTAMLTSRCWTKHIVFRSIWLLHGSLSACLHHTMSSCNKYTGEACCD